MTPASVGVMTDNVIAEQSDLTSKVMAAANYPAMFNELWGWVDGAIAEGELIDPRELHEFMRASKRRNVTDPVRAVLDSVRHPAE